MHDEIVEGFRLSPQQEHLWLLQQADQALAYRAWCVVAISGPLERELLHAAIRQVGERHEILRTTFYRQPEMPLPLQVIDEHAEIPLRFDDLSGLAPEPQAASAAALLREARRAPLDLAQGPLLQVVLIRLAADRHRLIVGLPALCADGIGLSNLVAAIARSYAAQHAHAEPADAPMQYVDLAEWQNELLEAEDSAARSAYWRTQDYAALTTLRLPSEPTVAEALPFAPDCLRTAVEPSLVGRIAALAQQHELAPALILQACWRVLLWRLSGQPELIVGVGYAGRKYPGLDAAIGLFAKYLPLQCQLADQLTFARLLRQLGEADEEAYTYQESFAWRQQAPADGAAPAFCPFCFDYEQQPAPFSAAGLTFMIDQWDSCCDRFKLKLVGVAAEGSLRIELHYDAQRYTRAAAQRLSEQFHTLLAGATEQPDAGIGRFALLSAAERQRVLVDFNQTATDYPAQACIHELFQEQARRTPDAIALRFEEQQLSYATLNARANQLAHHLRGLGVGPELRVGLCVERSPAMLIGMLGVLKAGGAYVPLDPAYPEERLSFLLTDSQAPVLLTQARLADQLPTSWAVLVCLDADWNLIDQSPTTDPAAPVTSDNLAYTIYTSGSAGAPKGVLVTHQNLVHSTSARMRSYPEPVGDFLLVSSFAFDSSVVGIYWTLCQGGCLMLPQEGLQQEPAQLVELIARRQISHLLSLPSLYALLLARAEAGQLASLRCVIVAGELCPAALVALHHAALANTALYNEYGPTECTVWSSVHACSPQAADAPVPIGRPISNTQIYLLDRYQPVPIGIPGEVYIGGAGLARGYLGRPELTAERFVPNPFAPADDEGRTTNDETDARLGVRRPASGVRLYKTGDLARYADDGAIVFLGRSDTQVKLRGYRIELDEIAAVLRQHPALREAAVLAREDAAGTARLVAYVVPTNDERRMTTDEERDSSSVHRPSSFVGELRAFLRERLPDYMIPAMFVSLKAMPRTPNGKLDRRALPAPDNIRPELEQRFVAARTPIEEVLAGIWAEVLDLAQVGIYDNFFDLGGHSLLVVQVLARVRDTLSVELPMRQVFETPTVAALAECIAAQRDTPEPLPPLRPVARDAALPLSFAQQRLWFLDQLEPGRSIYNLPTAVRLTGKLDVPALGRSLSAIMRRHEVLRTTFAIVDGHPIAQIAAAQPMLLPLISLLELAAPAQARVVMQLAQAEAGAPFDLARGPLLRATLIRLGAAEHVVLLNMHHIVSDAWSVGVFIRELVLMYSSYATGQPPTLPALPIQYADYALWQRQWLQGDVLERQLDYWRNQLAGLTPLDLPLDRPRPSLQSFRGAFQPFALAPELPAQLVALSRREGVTLFMLVLAAFQTLLMRYSGQDDIVIGTTIANRSRAETEPLIGFFLNTLALRTNTSGDPTFRTLLGRVREVCLGAYAHQDAPFEQVVEAVHAERYLSRHPLFQVSFALEHTLIAPVELPDMTLQPVAIDSTTTKFDLSLALREGMVGRAGGLLYSTDLFDAATVERMLGHLQMILAGIVAQPEQRLSELPLLTEAERELLLGWNAVRADYSRDRLTHQLFEAQAERLPDAVAVVLDQAHVTYRELNERANQLAQHLRTLAVRREVLVGVCMERTPDLVVALIAIFKAGGAYVPLDPTYPAERLAFMLADSRASVLITDSMADVRLPHDDLEEAQPSIANRTCKIVHMVADWPLIARQPAANLPTAVCAADLAYLIYTSGTTGRPKAVMVEHGNLLNTLLAAIARLNFVEREQIPCIAPFSFDIVLFELFTPLLLGGTAFLLTRDELLDVARFADLMRNVTLLHTSPGLMAPFVNYVRDNRLAHQYAMITRLFVGGDVIPTELVKDMQELFPAAQVYLGYGPTEGSIISTLYPVPVGHTVRRHVIGTPLNNMIVRLHDRYENLVPIGVPGELFIGGDGVTRGYWGRAELTAERFVPASFVSGGDTQTQSAAEDRGQIGYRLYKTGDLARWLPDGMIEFLGRIDNQVKLRGFRIELGEIETVLGQHPAVRACVVVPREDAPGAKRLVGYVVPLADEAGRTHDAGADSSLVVRPAALASELRTFLADRLPDYMIPAAFVLLDALPLTSNGKVDRRALPVPDPARPDLDDSYVAPRNAVETALAALWALLLRIERVGVYDNFFALGGDSILSIQIIAKARDAGLRLSPKDMFLHQTIAELATVAGSAPEVVAQQDVVSGAVPLTPVQQHFFAQEPPAPQHFNQALLLTTLQRLDPTLLARTLERLLAHHDALRLRFVRTDDGWQQWNAAAETNAALALVDLSGLAPAAQRAGLEAAAAALQTSLDLSAGPLLRAALFDLGAQPGRLLLVVHHLAVDGVSWRILLEDLYSAYTQLAEGRAVVLPPKTTSFQQWAVRLADYAQTVLPEQAYWRAIAAQAYALPRDHSAANTLAAARTIQGALTVEETHALLYEVPAAYRTQINDVLLTALVRAIMPWSGEARLLVDLEGHGREDLFADVDLSRTVGWFTTRYPVLLDVRGAAGPGAALQAVKEQLRAVPGRGIGYGLLRYLAADAELRAALAGAAEISFNYLGQVDQMAGATGGLFGGARESSGPAQDPRGLRSHALDVSGIVAAGQLHLTWTYSAALHEQATITALAERYLAALRELIAHCLMPDAGGVSPSDFPLARLDQPMLDRLLGGDTSVEDIYPLSPMQQGMLFHTLAGADAGTYTEHLSCTLRGDLDIAAFKAAWQQVVDRHPVFRTSFAWERLDEPLQLVWRRATLDWLSDDWHDLARDQQTARLDAFLLDDHARGFALAQAPLMRMALFRLAEDAHAFVWSHHHLLLDGWSLPLVLKEVVAGYAAARAGQAIREAPSQPYRDYIAWLQRQDLVKAEAFWRGALQGVTAPTPLVLDAPAAQAAITERYLEQEHRLTHDATAALQAYARQHGLTLNTLVQGAWALLLSRYSGADDVVFGVTVAGRPPELPGSEAMIGMFINTLPVRVPVPPQVLVLPWLRQLQEQQAELRQYEYSPLIQIQGWSGVPRGTPLFESILVFENYPVGEAVAAETSRPQLAITNVQSVDRNNYPLTLGVGPGPQLMLSLVYDRLRFDDAAITRLAAHYQQLLAAVVATPGAALAALPLLTEAEARQLHTWSTPPARVAPQPVYALIAAHARLRPDAVALVADADQRSYAALVGRANQLAQVLRAAGVGPELPVALALPPTADRIVALLAVLAAGGAVVPLDLSLPSARLATILDAVGAPLLLTAATLLDALPSTLLPPLCLDELADALAAQPISAPPWAWHPEQLAYLIFTSGSTGAPKGVAVPQRGLANLIAAQAAAFALTPASRVLQFAPLSVDAAIAEVLVTLGSGATLVLPAAETRIAGPALRAELARQQVTTVTLPPTVLGLLPVAALPQLTTLVAAGEACGAELVARWGDARRFVNAYGPTEATVCATLGACAPGAGVTIGRPLAGSAVYVLDGQQRLAGIGVVGELYLGGVGLARGYLGRPDLTAERFVPNPFVTTNDAGRRTNDASAPASCVRLYATGDLARWRADGQLEYVGRRDGQVKLRGLRVELGEVEAVLRSHPAVTAGVVLARTVADELRLVAYVVPADEGRRTNDEGAEASFVARPSSLLGELRALLKARLPEYMLPSAFVLLDALPLLPNGKLDRQALPEPERSRPEQQERYVAPRTPIEELLSSLWAEAFGLDQVGVYDNFFDLGGHSMLAMQLFYRICEAFQLELPLKMLLDAPTVAALAETITQFQIEQASAAAITATLEELNTLSDEELEALLSEEMQSIQRPR